MKPSKQFIAAVASVCVTTSPFAFAQTTPPPLVKSIEVQYAGPVTVSKSRILANMRTQVGTPYSDLAVAEDIRNLYKTGNISNVRIFGEPGADGVKVVVVIQTRATVQEVALVGVSEVKPKALRKLLITKPGEQLTESNLEADRQKILEYYQDKGFKDTAVTYETRNDEKTNKTVVTYHVAEAGKTVVKRIRFEGNAAFPSKELRQQIKTKSKNILSVFTKAGRLNNEQLTEDIGALKEFYQNHGYLDVRVSEPQIERQEKKADVDLIFTVQEGRQYHVGALSVSGNKLFTTAQLMPGFKEKPGAVFSPKEIAADVKMIQDAYGALGYVDVQVAPESTVGGPAINNLHFKIEEGAPSHVGHIDISGNTRSKDKVIRREMAVAPGDLYNTVRVDASKQRLMNLNYFERVDVFPSDSGVPGVKDVNVVVQEKHTGSFNFGAGYSSIDKLIGFVEVTQSNFDITNFPHFIGGGERFRARVQYGTTRKDFIVSLMEPYFLDYKLAVGVEGFYHDATYLSTVYSQRNYGFDVYERQAINESLAYRLDYRLEDIKIYGVTSGAPPAIVNDEGTKLQSQVGPSLTYDTRDSVFLTRKGTRAELSTYLAGGFLGGDVNIYGVNLDVNHFIHLPWDTILILHGEAAGVSTWSGGAEVPIFDRLYMGGSNNLRGFKFRDVGPNQDGEPTGGKSLFETTVEFTYPIIDRVRGAFFYDAGFVNYDPFSYGFGNLATDAGIGLRLDLPIGPIRLDYGYPIQRGDSTSHTGHFNFNVGYQF